MLKKIVSLVIFAVCDFIAVHAFIGISYVTRDLLGDAGVFSLLRSSWCYFVSHGMWMGLFLVGLVAYEGFYTQRKVFWEDAKGLIRVVTFWIIGITSVLALTREIDNYSRAFLLILWAVSLVGLPLVHYGVKKLLIRWRLYVKSVLIVGAGQAGVSTAQGFLRHQYLGYEIIGFVDDDVKKQAQMVCISDKKFSVFGTIDMCEELVKHYGVEVVVVAIPSLEATKLTHLTNQLHHVVKSIMVVPNIKGVSLTNASLHYLFEQQLFVLKLSNNLDSKFNQLLKRSFDLGVSILLLPILLPLLAIIGMLIKLESSGPVLFAHQRVGKGGRVIPTLKFRSMYKDSKERLAQILATDEEAAREWNTNFKLKNDPRVTKVGAFLRKSSLDELPQIFNVLAGQMSLVGPRPVIQQEIDNYYGKYAEYYQMVPPGITGLWQVSGRSDTSYDYRVGIDTWYVLNWTLWLDIVILFKTVKVVLKGDGAY